MMSQPPSPGFYPNLAAGQRWTQWLVDQFNDSERQWRDLQDKFHGVARRLKSAGRKRKKRTKRRIAGFELK
jgi:hypothetical protein